MKFSCKRNYNKTYFRGSAFTTICSNKGKYFNLVQKLQDLNVKGEYDPKNIEVFQVFPKDQESYS